MPLLDILKQFGQRYVFENIERDIAAGKLVRSKGAYHNSKASTRLQDTWQKMHSAAVTSGEFKGDMEAFKSAMFEEGKRIGVPEPVLTRWTGGGKGRKATVPPTPEGRKAELDAARSQVKAAHEVGRDERAAAGATAENRGRAATSGAIEAEADTQELAGRAQKRLARIEGSPRTRADFMKQAKSGRQPRPRPGESDSALYDRPDMGTSRDTNKLQLAAVGELPPSSVQVVARNPRDTELMRGKAIHLAESQGATDKQLDKLDRAGRGGIAKSLINRTKARTVEVGGRQIDLPDAKEIAEDIDSRRTIDQLLGKAGGASAERYAPVAADEARFLSDAPGAIAKRDPQQSFIQRYGPGEYYPEAKQSKPINRVDEAQIGAPHPDDAASRVNGVPWVGRGGKQETILLDAEATLPREQGGGRVNAPRSLDRDQWGVSAEGPAADGAAVVSEQEMKELRRSMRGQAETWGHKDLGIPGGHTKRTDLDELLAELSGTPMGNPATLHGPIESVHAPSAGPLGQSSLRGEGLLDAASKGQRERGFGRGKATHKPFPRYETTYTDVSPAKPADDYPFEAQLGRQHQLGRDMDELRTLDVGQRAKQLGRVQSLAEDVVAGRIAPENVDLDQLLAILQR